MPFKKSGFYDTSEFVCWAESVSLAVLARSLSLTDGRRHLNSPPCSFTVCRHFRRFSPTSLLLVPSGRRYILVLQVEPPHHYHTHTHARTHTGAHARTHIRTHARTHVRTHVYNTLSLPTLISYRTTRVCNATPPTPAYPHPPFRSLFLSHCNLARKLWGYPQPVLTAHAENKTPLLRTQNCQVCLLNQNLALQCPPAASNPRY